ncbi:GNAT family N-acetyltransferase [bacterium]|nr:GNAT family N-acetyltransferase [bacterium]
MAKKNEPEINVRLLIKRNLLDVLEIERSSCYTNDPDFGKIQNDFVWSTSSFTSFVRKKNTFSYVIYENSKIVGFILIENDPDETVIEKLVVHPKSRRKGYGTAMINFLIQKKFRNKISAYCREDDDDSIKFYISKKFKSKLQKKHFNNDTDAIKFTMEMDDEK